MLVERPIATPMDKNLPVLTFTFSAKDLPIDGRSRYRIHFETPPIKASFFETFCYFVTLWVLNLTVAIYSHERHF